MEAERRGRIKQGDTLIEATSGNTGIALAQAAAMRGFKMKLIMPANMSEERKSAMAAFGARASCWTSSVILTTQQHT